MTPSSIQLALERYHNMPARFHPDLHAFISSALENGSTELCRAAFEAAQRWLSEVPEYGSRASNNNDEHRAKPGEGEKVWIYVVGIARDDADGGVPAFGKISAGCGPKLREDFAKCTWPVVVKVKTGVPNQQLAQNLRDLADSVDGQSEPRPNRGRPRKFPVLPK